VPLASVVIPTAGSAFDAERPTLLLRAVSSVLVQRCGDFELVVVCDGPDEETEQVLRDIRDERLRTVFLERRVGCSEARNAGIREARGEYIALLDDDDEWFPDTLSSLLSILERASAPRPVAYGQVLIREPGRVYPWPRRMIRPAEPVSDYLFVRPHPFAGAGLIHTSTLAARSDLFRAVPFDPEVKRHSDWDWLLRASRHPGVVLVGCARPLAIWHSDPGRKRVSTTDDWEATSRWADRRRHLFTRRAYAAFLLVQVSAIAARAQSTKATLRLWKAARAHGDPRATDIALFLATRLLPWSLADLGRRLLVHRKGGPSGRPSARPSS
jgi:glycosyltransferase involved in cell wall biosynthesis